ncbi:MULTISPECIES: class I SAM-dependent methyltransferase [Exiguobacterium]|uniref:class I SAM-dependent methyltransferase n=1 Tax=Exiguobacterium TaxID=33986 RepID=UPI001BE5EE26|nr:MULTISPECIES: rRNA adenine N-6-methyltransferase family protein [Exiguobacterium]
MPLSFMKQFFKRPREVGSLVPSSRYLSERMTPTDELNRADVIIELGPGTGSFTSEIVRKMQKDTTLVLIETNRAFLHELRERYGGDRRIVIVEASATELKETLRRLHIDKVNLIISGLPFTSLGEAQTAQILQEVKAVLSPSELFLTFQYTKMRHRHFQHVFQRVRFEREFRNLPPAYLFHCTT